MTSAGNTDVSTASVNRRFSTPCLTPAVRDTFGSYYDFLSQFVTNEPESCGKKSTSKPQKIKSTPTPKALIKPGPASWKKHLTEASKKSQIEAPKKRPSNANVKPSKKKFTKRVSIPESVDQGEVDSEVASTLSKPRMERRRRTGLRRFDESELEENPPGEVEGPNMAEIKTLVNKITDDLNRKMEKINELKEEMIADNQDKRQRRSALKTKLEAVLKDLEQCRSIERLSSTNRYRRESSAAEDMQGNETTTDSPMISPNEEDVAVHTDDDNVAVCSDEETINDDHVENPTPEPVKVRERKSKRSSKVDVDSSSTIEGNAKESSEVPPEGRRRSSRVLQSNVVRTTDRGSSSNRSARTEDSMESALYTPSPKCRPGDKENVGVDPTECTNDSEGGTRRSKRLETLAKPSENLCQSLGKRVSRTVPMNENDRIEEKSLCRDPRKSVEKKVKFSHRKSVAVFEPSNAGEPPAEEIESENALRRGCKRKASSEPRPRVTKKVVKSSSENAADELEANEYADAKIEPENPRPARRQRTSRQSDRLIDGTVPCDTNPTRTRNSTKGTSTSSGSRNSTWDNLQAERVRRDAVSVGDFVNVMGRNLIGSVVKMKPDEEGKMMCHILWFIRGVETVLGDQSHMREIFQINECEDVNPDQIDGIYEVTRLSQKARFDEENAEFREWTEKSEKKRNAAFYQKRYEPRFGHFRDLKPDYDSAECISCMDRNNEEIWESPVLPEGCRRGKGNKYFTDAVLYKGVEYKVGSDVFIDPGELHVSNTVVNHLPPADEEYDENVYTEKYRKQSCREEATTLYKPFEVGRIFQITSFEESFSEASLVFLHLKKYYRPHDTNLDTIEANKLDLNLLFWSGEDAMVSVKMVRGKCFVRYVKHLDIEVAVVDWSAEGPYRFYFDETKYTWRHDPKTGSMKGYFSQMSAQDEMEILNVDEPPKWPSIEEPLSTMDLFCGCGGLSEGLKQSGVAECRWAVDKDENATDAFKLNNPCASVYTEDCQKMLEKFVDSSPEETSHPRKYDIELLCGGPPCQSIMDSSSGENKQTILTGSFISYCDYFRPKFVMLENVRTFITAKQGVLFRNSLTRLVNMGYQVTFGVLQCGSYGLPQSRRRAVILAAAPGEILPKFPEPTHAFSNKGLDVTLNKHNFTIDLQWTNGSAPYRMITVRDAISDLPAMRNGNTREKKLYRNEPLTHFQYMMRGRDCVQTDEVVRDHVSKIMSELCYTRIRYIPPLGDWRDLPNEEVQLSDGTYTKKLEYTHFDESKKRRGVCACATHPKTRCNYGQRYKQPNTLIPWCLPHTGHKHGQWAGLYGRLAWDGCFRTVVCNPDPMGKQGRVLHPIQNRVFSIRECARAQGMPDSFRFQGNVLERYAQVGNAFTPPLAKAIGYEIKKCVASNSSS